MFAALQEQYVSEVDDDHVQDIQLANAGGMNRQAVDEKSGTYDGNKFDEATKMQVAAIQVQ